MEGMWRGEQLGHLLGWKRVDSGHYGQYSPEPQSKDQPLQKPLRGNNTLSLVDQERSNDQKPQEVQKTARKRTQVRWSQYVFNILL